MQTVVEQTEQKITLLERTHSPHAKFLKLLLRIKLIEEDPMVEKQKIVSLPSDYVGLRQQIVDYVFPRGVAAQSCFDRLEEAGYPLFFNGDMLFLQTPKGFVRIARIPRH